MSKKRKFSIADKYYGVFKVEKWPEDIDEYAIMEMQKQWKQRSTTNLDEGLNCRIPKTRRPNNRLQI